MEYVVNYLACQGLSRSKIFAYQAKSCTWCTWYDAVCTMHLSLVNRLYEKLMELVTVYNLTLEHLNLERLNLDSLLGQPIVTYCFTEPHQFYVTFHVALNFVLGERQGTVVFAREPERTWRSMVWRVSTGTQCTRYHQGSSLQLGRPAIYDAPFMSSESLSSVLGYW